MSLKEKLEVKKAELESRTPGDVKAILEENIAALAARGVATKHLKPGLRAPSFELENSAGVLIRSADLLDRGPLVVSFYRGVWCPYCNIELQAYKDSYAAIADEGASLVVISPEKPEFTEEAKSGACFDYEVLFDRDNRVARQFGLVFEFTEIMKYVYMNQGLDIAERNDGAWELPVPATFVIDGDGVISLASVEVDYRNRLDPSAVIAELARLRREK